MYKKFFVVLLLSWCTGSQVFSMISQDEFLRRFMFTDKSYGEVRSYSSLTEADVTKRYRKLALQWHPDKTAKIKDEKEQAMKERLFKELGEAYTAYQAGEIGGGVKDDKGDFKKAYDDPASYHQSYDHLARDISESKETASYKEGRAKRSKTREERNKAWIPLTMEERLKRMREEEEPDLTAYEPKSKPRSTFSKALDFQPQIALDAADLATFTSANGGLLGLGSALSTAGRYADVFKGRGQVRDARTERQHDIVARRAHPVSDANPDFNRAGEATPAEYRDASVVTGAQKVARGLASADRQWGQGLITAIEQANTAFNAQTLLAYNKYLAENKDEGQVKQYMKEWQKKRRFAWILMALEAGLKNGALLMHTRRETDPNVSPPSDKDAGIVKGANTMAASGAVLGLLRKAYGAYIKNDHISEAQAHAERMFEGQQPQL